MYFGQEEFRLDQLTDIQKSIQQINSDNKMNLQEILAKRVPIQSTSILNLYQLVTQQWQRKQKIIQELSTLFIKQIIYHHHAANKIVELEQESGQRNHQTTERKIKVYEEIVEEAERQNEKFKKILSQKQKTIQQMPVEIEELKKFCEGLEARLDSAQSKIYVKDEQASKECAACLQYEFLLDLLKDEHAQEKDSCQMKKQQQIIQLKKQKRSFQRKIQELLDQNQQSKVELQLAEMVIKDALSFKDASFSNRSEELNKSDEIYTTQSHRQFLNGELECFSNIEEQPNQFNRQKASQQTYSNINILPSSNDKYPEYSFQLKLCSNNDETTLPNPFRKKIGREERRYNTEVLNNDLSDSFRSDIKQKLMKIEKEKKTVALQCNLLKNVPKIIMFSKKELMKKEQEQSKTMMKSRDQIGNNKKEKRSMSKSQRSMTKSMICLSNNHETLGQNSLSKLFTFLSSKIITNRIKTK